jgi:hypothetical protein
VNETLLVGGEVVGVTVGDLFEDPVDIMAAGSGEGPEPGQARDHGWSRVAA